MSGVSAAGQESSSGVPRLPEMSGAVCSQPSPRDGLAIGDHAGGGNLSVGLDPITLDRKHLRGRNFLLGNKQGLMLHLPAANGAGPRTIHRSKWYGGSIGGRKFLEAVICRDADGMLSRSRQALFSTDGLTARRVYGFVDAPPVEETYFVPDFLPAVLWSLGAANSGQSHHDAPGRPRFLVEPLFDLGLTRTVSHPHAISTERVEDGVVISRDIDLPAGDVAEGVDTGGTPLAIRETLWAVCFAEGGELTLTEAGDRWRPMWYSLDAARRRYLKRLALHETPVIEHAPLWELASEWVYAPCRVMGTPGMTLSLGFGASRSEAVESARTALAERRTLMAEKAGRLKALLASARFSCGHGPTDKAYGHVLSRLHDCLIVRGAGHPAHAAREHRPSSAGGAGRSDGTVILAGDAYFQEAWKRDENIALGGLLASGSYDIAREVIDSTWQGQDPVTGRLPLRQRAGEVAGFTSSDATLWALVRLAQYTRVSGDEALIGAKLPLVAHFFRRSVRLSRRGLLPSGGIAVPSHTWETWMDTEFSSRAGFPIEIQLLWLASLLSFAPAMESYDAVLAGAMQRTAERLRRSLDLFRHGDHFVDHLGLDLRPVDLITPNSFFWTVLGLDFDWTWEERALALGRWELGGVSGIRTLARSQWSSVLGPEVSALARAGRPLPSIGKATYHRGVEWNWLSQLFVAGELKHGRPDLAYDHYLARQVHDAISYSGLGGVSEVFDHRGPAGPDFQTWSMSSFVESLHRFVGVEVDVPAGLIAIHPQKHRRWPFLAARKWFGARGFDVEYRSGRGTSELGVSFDQAPPPGIRLKVSLPVGHHQVVRSLAVRSGSGEHVQTPWSRGEQPSRVELELLAERDQLVRLEVGL